MIVVMYKIYDQDRLRGLTRKSKKSSEIFLK